MAIQHLFLNSQKRVQDLIAAAAVDVALYEAVVEDFVDFGHKIDFYWRGGAGLYLPHILATERLDTARKSEMFSQAFLEQCDRKLFPARIGLLRMQSFALQLHTFLHEVMHFYQDMHGFYYAPLREEGVFPVMLDARSRVVLTLFNECWAACESIRAGWRLKEQGHDAAWRGALMSKDWSDLARVYGENLGRGMDEADAALRMQEQWYNAPQREFYEREALAFFTQNIGQYAPKGTEVELNKFRTVRISDLIVRMPDEGALSYFKKMDVHNPLFTEIRTPLVLKAVESFEAKYIRADNPNIQDIKCGSPPYLWHRVLENARETSEIPPPSFEEAS